MVAALVLVGAVSVAAGAGSSNGGGPFSENQAARDAFARAQQEQQEREAFRASARGRAERDASRDAFRHQSDAQALATARSEFRALVETPPLKWPLLQGGQRLDRYLGDQAAVVTGANGKGAVLESNLPLRGRTPDGAQKPLDLALDDQGDSYAPKSTLGPVRIPKRSSGDLRFPEQGFAIKLAGAEPGEAKVTSNKAFFANVLTDSDLVMEPAPLGAEISLVLRSPASPSTPSLKFELAPGQRLRLTSAADENPGPLGSAEVVKGKDRVALISPAWALDAQGKAIDVGYRVDGDTLVMEVHDDGDIAYPVMVDPTTTVYDPNGQGVCAPGEPHPCPDANGQVPAGYYWPGWTTGTTSPPNGACPAPAAPSPQHFSSCKPADGELSVTAFRSLTNGQTYPLFDMAYWQKKARSGTYIWRLDGNNMSHLISNPSKSAMFAGVCSTNCGSWEWGHWFVTGGSPYGGTSAINQHAEAVGSLTEYYCVDPRNKPVSEGGQGLPAEDHCWQGATADDPNGQSSHQNNLARWGMFMLGGFPNVNVNAVMGAAATLSADNVPPKITSTTHTNQPPADTPWLDSYSDTATMRAADNDAVVDNTYTFGSDLNVSGDHLTGVGVESVAVSSPTQGQVGEASAGCDTHKDYDQCPQVLTFQGIPYTAGEGTTTYTPSSTDLVGNAKNGTPWTVRVDQHAPAFGAPGGPLAANGVFVNDLATTLIANASDSLSGVQNVELQVETEGPNAASSVLASDGFGRSTANGWGNADKGGAWTVEGGSSAANFSTGGGVGTISTPSNAQQFVRLPDILRARDVDATVRIVLPDSVPASGFDDAFLDVRDQTRSTDPAQNGYAYRVALYRDSTGKLSLLAENSDSQWVGNPVDAGLQFQAGASYYLRAKVTGANPTTIQAHAWKAGTAEPSTWPLTLTDSTKGPQYAGRVGLRTWQNASTGSRAISFDDLKVTSLDQFVTKGYKLSSCDTVVQCPTSVSRTFTFDASDYAEGSHRIRTVARDPVAAQPRSGMNEVARHVTTASPLTMNLDRTGPGISNPRGPLSVNGGWIGGPAGATVDTTDNLAGVRRAELHMDGSPTAADMRQADCTGGCPKTGFSPTLTWTPGGADADGQHAAKITAVDDASNPRDLDWSIGLDRLQPADFTPTGSLWNGESSSGELGRRNHKLDVTATDAHSGVKRVEAFVDDADNPNDTPLSIGFVNGACSATGCPSSVPAHFEWDSRTVSYNRVHVRVRVTDQVDNYRDKSKDISHDGTPPVLQLSGPMAPPVASGRALHMTGDDSGTGVAKFELWLDPPANVDGTAPTHTFAPPECSTTCPPHAEDDWVLPDTTPEGTHTVHVRLTDDAGLIDEERFDIHVVSLFPSSRTKLGLEHYFQYDDTPAGGNSKVFVNAESGNAVWHSVPIVNPGRGLSTVVNLTYNSHDRGGILGSSLGHIPIVDVSGANLAQDLPGLSYAEAGVGFSLGISGPTRLNEPLGGVLVAQAVEEGTELPELGHPLPQVADMRITMTDADGTVHSFQRSGQQWVGDPGLDLHLRRYKNGGNLLQPIDDKWAITRPDGVTFFYDNLGYLTSAKDRNGNTLTYHYDYYDAISGDVTKTVSNASGGQVQLDLCRGVKLGIERLGKYFEISADPNNPDDPLATPQKVYCAKRVDRVTDAGGRDLKIEYNDYNGELLGLADGELPVEMRVDFPGLIGGKAGRIKKVTDHANREYAFEYDDYGYLTKLTEAANATDTTPRVTKLNYEDWKSPVYKQIGQDRQLTEVVEADGGVDGRKTTVRYVDPDDRHAQFAPPGVPPGVFAPPRQVCGVTKRNDGEATQTPQHQDNQMCRTRRSNLETTYDYVPASDSNPTQFKATEVLERAATAAQSPKVSATTTSDLDGRGRPTQVADPLGRKTALAWSDDENAITSFEKAKDTPDAARTDLTYDQSNHTGVLLSKKTYPNYPDLSGARTTSFTYQFSNGLYHSSATGVDDSPSFVADLTQIDKPRAGTGSSFEIKQDASGNYLGNVTRSWSQPGRQGPFATMTYDGSGQLATEQSGVPAEPVTQYPTYDPSGSPTKVIDPRGKSWAYRYDDVGNLKFAVDPRGDQANVQDGNNYTTTLSYDAFDRVKSRKLPLLSAGGDANVPRFRTTSRTYDRNGNVKSATDGAGKATSMVYTAMDQPRRVTQPGRPARPEVTDYVYDDADRLIARVDPKGTGASAATIPDQDGACTGDAPPPVVRFMTRYCLDKAGRRTAEVRTAATQDLQAGDRGTLITGFAFDGRDNTVGMVDSKRTNLLVKDAVAAAVTAPRVTYTYNKVDERTDQRESVLDTAGNRIARLRTHYDYDANGNPTTVLPPRAYEGSPNTPDNPTSADNSFATTKFYDARDLLTAVKTPGGGCTAYGRREDGKVVAETKPRGTELDTTGNGANGDCSPGTPFKYKYFTTVTSYDGQGNVASRSIPYAPNQYGRSDTEFATQKVSYARDDVGNPQDITDPRGHAFHNTFYDTGELRSTERPSFFELDWGEQSYKTPDPARHFKDESMGTDFEIADGGPTLKEVDGARSRNAEKSTDVPKLPDSHEAGNFGKVEPEDLGDLLPDAGSMTLRYDGEMRLASITDAAGNDRTIDYDDAGRVVAKSWAFKSNAPIRHTFAYDLNGNLESYNDGRTDGVTSEHQTTYVYDGFDRRIQEQTPGAASSPSDSFQTETTKYGYDANGNLVTRQTPLGTTNVFGFTYDSVDRLIDERNPIPSGPSTPNGEHWAYGYDANGNVTSERSPRYDQAAAGDKGKFETQYAYDKSDRMSSKTVGFDTHGDRVTQFAYDADGNRNEVITPGSAETSGGSVQRRVRATAYDGRGLPWRERSSGADGSDARVGIKEYDANGNLVRVVDGKGVNATTLLPKVANTPTTSMADATWHATVREYDNDDQITNVWQPWSKSGSGGGDPQGPQDAEEGGDERRFMQEFQRSNTNGDNPLKRISSIVAPHETSDSRAPRTSYTYWQNGWIHTQSEQKMVRPASTQPIETALITYDYDATGNQTSWRTASSSTGAGRVVTRTFWDDGTLRQRDASKGVSGSSDVTQRFYRYFYDKNRSLVRLDDFDAVLRSRDGTSPPAGTADRITNITRDAAERPTVVNETWPDGRDSFFRYDPAGNVSERKVDGRYNSSGDSYTGNDAKVTTFTYDPLDREVSTRVDPPGGAAARTTTTKWWDSGDMSERTKSNGTVESYFYNPSGEIARKLRDPEQGSTDTQEYTYDANGNRTKDERGTHLFDARNVLVKWTRASTYEQKAGTTVTYERNGSSDITKKTDTYQQTGVVGPTTTTYNYDGDRLRSADTTVPTQIGVPVTTHADYSYDDLGSVTKVVSNQTGPATPPADPPNGPPSPVSCQEMPSTAEANVTRYCFDEFERMVSSRGEGVLKPSNYVFDGLDRRDRKTVDEGTSHTHDFSYVGTSRLLSRETDSDGELKTYDYDSQGRRLNQSIKKTSIAPIDVKVYAKDANGSVLGLEDQGGSFGTAGTDTYLYDPYGESDKPVPNSTPSNTLDPGLSAAAKDNPFRFEGFYYDSGVKTYDMDARQYRPDVGRYLSEDRFESAAGDQFLQADPLTQNRYAFAGGNPVNNVEFDGHRPLDGPPGCIMACATSGHRGGGSGGRPGGGGGSGGGGVGYAIRYGAGVAASLPAPVLRVLPPPLQIYINALSRVNKKGCGTSRARSCPPYDAMGNPATFVGGWPDVKTLASVPKPLASDKLGEPDDLLWVTGPLAGGLRSLFGKTVLRRLGIGAAGGAAETGVGAEVAAAVVNRIASGAAGSGGEIAASLEAHLSRAIERFGEQGFTDAQKAALRDKPYLRKLFRGERIDAFVRQSVRKDRALSSRVIETPRGMRGPDFIDPRSGVWYDVTTPRSWGAHLSRYNQDFGPGIGITYTLP